MVLAERIPGADEQALSLERALIGGCLLDTRGCREWPLVPAGHFFLDRHQWIWEAMIDLTEMTDRPDVTLLAHELRRREILEEVGNVPYLAQLIEEGMAAVDLRRYGECVRRGKAERDRMMLAAELLAHPEGSEQVEAILRSLEEQPGHSEPLSVIFPRLERDGTSAIIETGFDGLDLRRGTVTVIGGRTSHGKTAYVVDLTKRLARQDVWVEFVTLEDPPEAIAARLLAGEAGQSVYYVRMSKLAGLDRERQALELLSIGVISVPGCRESAVLGAVAASRAEVVIVDHLQQIGLDGTGTDESRNHVLERIMGRLSAIARRDNKAIVLTAQLNREMEKTKREPTLADLRDSGAIEMAARAVWLIYWPAKHDNKKDPEDFVVKIEKASEGPTFRRWLKWDSKSGRFWDPKAPEVPDW